ncbi:cysteine synthase family protein [Streptomyces vinaceus]|uniref:Cysteine synthase family protein n=1 Tax=Streptomyces vinaceus TaxID=1960 RepID=A0A5J6JB96_STRVI|nr:cysteine synthase family protein [Streptomyces vinaceus]QEV48487.1 cysteine synthase family protein [Streptomyces vinaceus]GHE74506.1 2,3-diaminopropionate biosynthesis protein SbnA [Streptomyces vinaceus]
MSGGLAARRRAIGGTPLLSLGVPLQGRIVWLRLKVEAENCFGSIKARTAQALLESLEAAGRLGPGSRVVESTSGNLGVALAGLCAERGYRCTLVVEPSTPQHSRDEMAAYGADVVVVREVAGGRTLSARLDAVRDILASDPTAVWTDQYENPANPQVHQWGTAAELAQAVPQGELDAVSVAVSTGGTLAGIAGFFREHRPQTRLLAVDAVGSAALGGTPGDRPFKLPGFGSGQRSRFLTGGMWDRTFTLHDVHAATACHRIASSAGVRLGGSGGAAVLAALLHAQDTPSVSQVVCVCPDGGDKYEQIYAHPLPALPEAGLGVLTALDALGAARLESGEPE